MTKEGARKLTAAFEETFGGLEGAIEQVPALLGAYIDGQKFIVVTDQPDYVWCRIGGNESRRVKAFNQHAGGVAQHWDLPIIIVKDKLNSNVWKVIGRDITRYPDWGQTANYPYSSPYIAQHGADHSFSSQAGMGADPVWVFKRQMMPLLPHPAVSGSMGIEIGSDFYYFDGSYRWFASTGTVDFTPALPTGAVNARFMTVFIDGTTGNPGYITGTEFNAVTPPIDPGEYISTPTTAQGIAVAAIFLLTGTARIGWGEIYDLRHPHTPVPTGPLATQFVVGQPTSLGDGVTGVYWLVDDGEYLSGSLAVSLNGAVQTPTVDYQEQYPASGTYEIILGDRPPAGSTQVVWYGVEV